MIIARKSWNFYSILDIDSYAFEDIKQRLIAKELTDKYLLLDDDGQEIIVFGTTALRAEKK